ncbi:probable NAD(P)H dehydrogenase subunit CRR3, chloroplastic isoform X2 [Carica papaya]|uniref:probable NAD(P)H dehydrogenase subunit CRR3, chloroplastic isoform X2 n=1 Tax=Carica papaya TaxID=3649 RepID=UPI000B8CEB68|nr:probable NAD(P)H dehydrogenase subunit CRR3, chloroplastic isoform X2 [Carica papaya]
MPCISFFSTTKPTTFASLAEETPSPRLPTSKPAKRPKLRTRNKPQPPHLQSQSYNSPNSSIIQIERAIGAGSYRDTDPGELRKRNTVFDGILPTGGDKFEGEIEKKIRETGEWLSSRTEARFRSSACSYWRTCLCEYIFQAEPNLLYTAV